MSEKLPGALALKKPAVVVRKKPWRYRFMRGEHGDG